MSHVVKPLPSVWISHLPSKNKEEIDDFSMAVRNSTTLTNRLIAILKQREDALYTEEASPEFYGTPEVSHRLAYNAGRRHILREVLKLLDF